MCVRNVCVRTPLMYIYAHVRTHKMISEVGEERAKRVIIYLPKIKINKLINYKQKVNNLSKCCLWHRGYMFGGGGFGCIEGEVGGEPRRAAAS